jgi:tetratricopeptide (TPR) repeat protein
VARAQSVYEAVAAERSPISAEIHATFSSMQAWQHYAHHRDADALAKLSDAADEQDRVGQAEVDIPVREMYADMLLAQGDAGEALTQYKAALRLSPNRFDGLAGAARAAAAAGQGDEARRLYCHLLQVANGGRASQRPEIAQARAFLHQRGKVST